jgi:hypothetical protein
MNSLCLVTIAVYTFCAPEAVQDRGLLPNPGFEEGLSGWLLRPGDSRQVSVVDGGPQRGKVLQMRPAGRLLGVETERLELGHTLKADQAYRVEAQLNSGGLAKGIFAMSMYCFDDHGKPLRQIAFYGLSVKSAAHDWRRVRGEFGPGTRNALPAGTRAVCIRFSFYEAAGDCQGQVDVDDVVLRPYTPPGGAGWPAEIVAEVGDLGIRFESRSFWTLYRIDYKGTRLCVDRFGSHYGSVANFPKVGFIGSGHTENEDEQVLDLRLTVDGKPVAKPESPVRCQSIRLLKKSRIRALVLNTEIEVRDGRILEDVRLRAERPTPVSLIYHFMHPWTPTATEYLAELADGTRLEGVFNGDGKQKIDKPTRWSAIYDGPSAKGAVTVVVAAPTEDDWRTRYWARPPAYRKHYFVTFLGRTIPADREFHYRVVTVPFAAPAERWKEEAARLAVSELAGS